MLSYILGAISAEMSENNKRPTKLFVSKFAINMIELASDKQFTKVTNGDRLFGLDIIHKPELDETHGWYIE